MLISLYAFALYKDFYECAYNSSQRQDLVTSITSFTNRNLCLVVPLGAYDTSLLAPTLEWMRGMMRKKLDKINRLKAKAGGGGSPPVRRRKIEAPTPRAAEKMNGMSTNTESEDRDHGVIENLPVRFEEKFDPFRQTGTMFGSLKNEIRHRYAKYASDLTDGLNLNCLIAFVFVFTLCIAPALCFGGILCTNI